MRSIKYRLGLGFKTLSRGLVLLLFFFQIFPSESNADVTRNFLVQNLRFHDPSGQLKINQIEKISFEPNAYVPDYAIGHVWHKLTIDAPEQGEPLVLKVSPRNRNNIAIFVRDIKGSQKWMTEITGNGVSWNNRTSYRKNFEFLLNLSEKTDVYLRVASRGNTTIKASALLLKDAALADAKEQIWRTIYLIILSTVVLWATYAFRLFKRISSLFFIIGHGLYLLLAISMFDYIAPIFPKLAVEDDIIANIIPYITLFMALFHRTILKERESLKSILLFIDISIICVCISLVVTTIIDPRLGHQLNNIAILSLLPAFLIAAFTSKKKTEPSKKIFTLYYILLYISICYHLFPIIFQDLKFLLPNHIALTLTHSFYSSVIFGHLIYIKFKRDLQQRHEAQTELAVASRELDLQKLKLAEQETLTAMLAHELKNPLASIRLTTDIIKTSSKSQSARLNRIDASINIIDSLIDRFVLSDKIEQNKIKLNFERLDIKDIFESQSSRSKTEREVIFNFTSNELIFFGDKFLITTVLNNIIDNALKYSTPGTAVYVSAGINENVIFASIENNVLSDTQFDVNQIFEKYYRGINAKRARGSGMGLYIVKWIVEKHNGQISFNTAGDKVTVNLEFPR